MFEWFVSAQPSDNVVCFHHLTIYLWTKYFSLYFKHASFRLKIKYSSACGSNNMNQQKVNWISESQCVFVQYESVFSPKLVFGKHINMDVWLRWLKLFI